MMDAVVRKAVSAIERRDWDALTALLHPYVHWTRPDGRTIRGRKKVLAQLAATPPSGPPARHELRDEQIYRWTEDRGPN